MEVGRGFILRLPVERIVIAPVAEVQETSRCGEEIKGGLGISARALEDSSTLAGPFFGFFQMKEQGEPDGEVVVAQAAGTVFEIRLEMEDGVAILGVARSCNLAQLLSDRVPLAQNEAGKNRLVELLVERKLAGEEAAIEGCQREFEVVRIETGLLL